MNNSQACSRKDHNITKGEFPPHTPVGMAYVPFQEWEEPYAENTALAAGTIFPSLNLPFKGKEVRRNG